MSAYPFVPKSNRYLKAGQFWALPLSDGTYGCGRLMAVPAFGAKDRVGFVAGLAGWIGSEPPTEATIAGAPVLLQAKAHFETISKCNPPRCPARNGRSIHPAEQSGPIFSRVSRVSELSPAQRLLGESPASG